MTSINPDRLEHLVSNIYEAPDCSLIVACESPQQAAELTEALYNRNSGEVLHVEHYPVTDDENGCVNYYALLIRRVTYDHDVGWCSADVSGNPDFDLRDNDRADNENDSTELPALTVSDERRYAVCAETVQDPYHNYTILGRIIELDRVDFDSNQEAAEEAAQQAVNHMPESLNDIVDEEFRVFEVGEDSMWVSVKDLTSPTSRKR